MLQSGRYSCCTMSNAVCCTPRNSCCPEHYVCDPASNLCAPESLRHKLIPTAPTSTTTHTTTTTTTTQTTTTTIQETTTTTQVTTTTTAPSTAAEKSLRDTAGISKEMVQKCPAGDVYCFRANNTCCRMRVSSQAKNAAETTFGCCPDENAVCCSDQVNCCPAGFACIRGTSSCVQTAPVGKSGAYLPSRLVYDAQFEPRRLQAMRVVPGWRH
ncbi:progranulin-like [Haemaphysalis longicornis]